MEHITVLLSWVARDLSAIMTFSAAKASRPVVGSSRSKRLGRAMSSVVG